MHAPLIEPRFPLEQCSLPIDSPSVSGETSIASNHPMTRNENGERIRRTRMCYCPD